MNRSFLPLLFTIIFCCTQEQYLAAQSISISDVIYLQENDGLKQRVIRHVIRGANGYFYLFGDNHIQRFDGKVFKDVDHLVLLDHKIKLRDLISVTRDDDNILLEFLNQKVSFHIPPGKLHVDVLADNKAKDNVENYIVKTKDKVFNVSANDSKYLFDSNFIYKMDGEIKEVLFKLPHQDIAPKFIRMDNKENIIAVYSKGAVNFIHHIYILDNNEKLYDLSEVVGVYSTALDIYAEDAFYKWMITGYKGIKIVTFVRDGIDHIDKNPQAESVMEGRIITGIASGDDEVVFCSDVRYISRYDGTEDFKWFDKDRFKCRGFGQCKYNELDKTFLMRGYESSRRSNIYEMSIGQGGVKRYQFLRNVRDFVVDKNNSLIVACIDTLDRGEILAYDRKTEQSNILVNNLPPLSSIYYSVTHDQYWVGSKKGLFVFDSEFNLVVTFSMQADGDKMLLYDEIITVAEFADHMIVCSDGGGVYLIDPLQMKITRSISEKEGLSNSTAVSVLVDDDNNCWVGTYNGLNVLNDSFNVIKKVYDFHGLPNREFNRMAATKHQGHLYFGTMNGMCKVNPNKVLKWEESHKLSIDKIQSLVNNKAHLLNMKEPQDIYDSAEALTIDYTLTDYYKRLYNTININYTTNQEELKAEHQEGQIRIRKLKPGSLVLSLVPEHTKKVQQFRVNVVRDYSPIIKWFLIIASMLFLSILIAYSVIRYNKKKEEQKTSTNKKISELQLSALQGQMNPHFIFNALGAIQYFIQTNDTNKADEYLSDFALLMRGILDSSSKKYISLKEELNLLKLYTNLEKARFENKFEVNFKINHEVDEETLIPPMIIQPYVENAINHGLHHLKNKQGKLDIILDNIHGNLSVIIKDNGIGRKAAAEIQVGKKHKSKGMSITQDRIETLNSSSDINISMEIKDLQESSYALGTEVNLLFKDV